MSYTTSAFAIRTVRNGAVRIGGKEFRPREYYEERDGWHPDRPYRDELEGMRLAFGRYRDYRITPEFKEFVWLWGNEERFFRDSRDDNEGLPHCIDGTFYFSWWFTEAEWQRHSNAWQYVQSGAETA